MEEERGVGRESKKRESWMKYPERGLQERLASKTIKPMSAGTGQV
jgi:hypothetical protein